MVEDRSWRERDGGNERRDGRRGEGREGVEESRGRVEGRGEQRKGRG